MSKPKLTWKDLMKDMMNNEGGQDSLDDMLNDPAYVERASLQLAQTMQEAIDTSLDWSNEEEVLSKMQEIEDRVPELKMERIIQDRRCVHIPKNRTLH